MNVSMVPICPARFRRQFQRLKSDRKVPTAFLRDFLAVTVLPGPALGAMGRS
jgi:hypothetical protein